jgi:hypothetical protein
MIAPDAILQGVHGVIPNGIVESPHHSDFYLVFKGFLDLNPEYLAMARRRIDRPHARKAQGPIPPFRPENPSP